MDMMREAIEQRAGQTLIAEDARPFLEWQIRRDDGRATFVTLAEYFKQKLRAGLRERHITEFVDDEQFDGGELRLEFQETPLVARLHQLMNEAGRREEGDREAALAGGQAERQTGMRLSRAGITQSNNIVAGDEIFAAREFECQRLVERWNGGEVERVETFHRRKMRGADAALDHAPFAIDEFEFGEAQEEADMIERPSRAASAATFSYSRRKVGNLSCRR